MPDDPLVYFRLQFSVPRNSRSLDGGELTFEELVAWLKADYNPAEMLANLAEVVYVTVSCGKDTASWEASE